MKQRTWFDNIADLLSGRIYNTLRNFNNLLVGQPSIQILEEKITMLTKHELVILGAAQTIGQSAQQIKQSVDAVVEKLAGIQQENTDLRTQLASATNTAPPPEPENLDDELKALQDATDGLAQLAVNMGAIATPPNANLDVAVPVAPAVEPMPPEMLPATPLASSGPSDFVPENPVKEGEQFSVPAQPGTGGGGEVTSSTPVENIPAEVSDWLDTVDETPIETPAPTEEPKVEDTPPPVDSVPTSTEPTPPSNPEPTPPNVDEWVDEPAPSVPSPVVDEAPPTQPSDVTPPTTPADVDDFWNNSEENKGGNNT